MPTRTVMPWRVDRLRPYPDLDRSALHVAVLDTWLHAPLPQPAGELVGDHDAAVAATGAPDGDGQVPLPLGHVAGQEDVEQTVEPHEELLGLRVAEHVLAHRPVAAGLRAQL